LVIILGCESLHQNKVSPVSVRLISSDTLFDKRLTVGEDMFRHRSSCCHIESALLWVLGKLTADLCMLHDSLANSPVPISYCMWRVASWAEPHEGVSKGGTHASRPPQDEAQCSLSCPLVSSTSLLHLQILTLGLHLINAQVLPVY
jgi:hypothetical protein